MNSFLKLKLKNYYKIKEDKLMHYTPNDLKDPQQFQTEYPDTVKAIDPFYWDNVEVGHYVKIRSANEWFWVQVTEITDDEITGEVYYELGTNSYQIGDTLTFNKSFQFDIHNPQVFNLIPGIDV